MKKKIDKFAMLKASIIKRKWHMAAGVTGLALLAIGIIAGSFMATKGLLEIRTNSAMIGVDFGDSSIYISPNKIWMYGLSENMEIDQYINVSNRGNKDMELTAFVTYPSQYDKGYKPIPAQWTGVDSSTIKIAAGDSIAIPVTVKIPQVTDGEGKALEFMIGIKEANPSAVSTITCIKFFINME